MLGCRAADSPVCVHACMHACMKACCSSSCGKPQVSGHVMRLLGHLGCMHRYLAKRAAYVDLLHSQLQKALAKQQQQQQSAWASACKQAGLRVDAEVRPWRLDGVKTVVCLRFVPLKKETETAKRTATAAAAVAADADELKAQQRLCRQLQNWELRLFVACCGGLFKEKFLRPNANAVRRRTTATKGMNETKSPMETHLTDAQVRALPPTPYYNGLVLEDCQ